MEVVSDDYLRCKSDYFGIKFEIKLKVKRKKPQKVRTFNYKRADWDRINIDLNNVNWNQVLDGQHPDNAWDIFKRTLNTILETHISKITIKNKSQPPWFDSECYEKCREKERLHKKFKRSKRINDEIKFTNCRREFKKLMQSKIRDNLYCSDSQNDITKQF